MKGFIVLMVACVIVVLTFGAIAWHDHTQEPRVIFKEVNRKGPYSVWINEHNNLGYYEYSKFENYAECASAIGEKVAELEASAASVNSLGRGAHIKNQWVVAADLEYANLKYHKLFSDGRTASGELSWKCVPKGGNPNPI